MLAISINATPDGTIRSWPMTALLLQVSALQ
jgi:hypothetical protein